MNFQEMGQRSRAAQIKKYGGKKAFKKEMARRGVLGNAKRWPKDTIDKNK